MKMHSKISYTLFLTLRCLFLLSPPAFCDQNSLLFHTCSTSQNFTHDSPYALNLKQAFYNLASTTPPSGFALASIGHDLQSQVDALALCRGDVSPADCAGCIATAGHEIQQLCPYGKGGAIWYDFCLLRYSNAKFFGKIDNGARLYMWNVEEAENAASFNEEVRKLLMGLSEKVEATPNLYAVGEVEMEGSKKVYGLVQCTRDLSSGACKKCVDDAIAELPKCCDAKIGGRVIGGSCNFRYEVYPFVKDQK
ncbi:cysteine-rich repeat secretory protein 38-like [Momordica charantia]|uniref:Cysteine-rich repeat secretory protein 38-like n=1 Tax=Momordica charantia TaxID=3673 RepID=A0A6J1C3J2_MOMCH|nr:cysteine-rich repeat secretory protein 38-like [Momordica charantia]